jgi:hypothetical protein
MSAMAVVLGTVAAHTTSAIDQVCGFVAHWRRARYSVVTTICLSAHDGT